MLFKFEEELRPSVKQWVIDQGLEPKDEIPTCGKIPDILGVKDDEIKVAIEMKLSNWQRALYQAIIYTTFTNKSYVAMPQKKEKIIKKNIDEFKRWGIGVLLVGHNNKVFELQSPSTPILNDAGKGI
jgi:hypothetical protein